MTEAEPLTSTLANIMWQQNVMFRQAVIALLRVEIALRKRAGSDDAANEPLQAELDNLHGAIAELDAMAGDTAKHIAVFERGPGRNANV